MAEKKEGTTKKKQNCFIIMPITTTSVKADSTRDLNHFKNVMTELFVPAIEEAGLKPISPSATGNDLIHARIIQYIETADFVLCDISDQNPNVMFEVGLRTALDKPICWVREKGTIIPFDVNGIHIPEYNPDLRVDIVRNEIPKLTAHIREVADNKGGKSLREAFSLGMTGQSIKPGDLEERFNILAAELNEVKMNIDHNSGYRRSFPKMRTRGDIENWISSQYQEDIHKFDLFGDKFRGNFKEFIIHNLSRAERTVFILYFFEDMCTKEIAECLDLSESRVSQIKTVLLDRLSQKFDEGRDHEDRGDENGIAV